MNDISLQAKAVLTARERRYEMKRLFFLRYRHCVVIEVAMNVPGLPKVGRRWRRVHRRGLQQLQHALPVVAGKTSVDKAGYYALLAVSADLAGVKRIASSIEEQAPWGRLLDIDCFGNGVKLSRQAVGLPERPCFVCGRPHSLCLGAKVHSIEAARAAAEAMAETCICAKGS